MKVITKEFSEFFDDFTVIKNHLDQNASYDGYLYETYGEEVQHVFDISKEKGNRVWTVVESDGVQAIVDGYNLVNRIGYFITEENSDPKVSYEYVDEDDMDDWDE